MRSHFLPTLLYTRRELFQQLVLRFRLLPELSSNGNRRRRVAACASERLASQVKMEEWNPEKDLLATVTEDSKVVLGRFNWQRLWTICPGKCITSLCWRPDGKVVVLGLEDGTVSLHDVGVHFDGKLLRSLKSHAAAVVCLNWEEDAQVK